MRRRPEIAAAALFAASIAGEVKAQPDAKGENKSKTHITVDARAGTAPLPGTAASIGGEVGAKRHVHIGPVTGEIAGGIGAVVGLKRTGGIDGTVVSIGAAALADIPRAPFPIKAGPAIDLRLAMQNGTTRPETGVGARAEVDLAPGIHAGVEYKAVIGLGKNASDQDSHPPHIAHEGGINVGIDF